MKFNYFRIYFSTLFHILGIVVISVIVKTQASVRIELSNEVIHWTDCVLRKSVIPANESDSCYRCTMNPNLGVPLEVAGWNQKYINCSDFCDYITICSEAKYYTVIENLKEPIYIPVCYQCENRKTEDIYFELIRDEEICSMQCAMCAVGHDILTASECAKHCTGLPTFCYPIERWFNHRKCYRATFWYGCVYKPPSKGNNLTSSCKECAKQARNLEDAQECAIECNGFPTYVSDPSSDASIVQCVERPPAAAGDFFYYNIPQPIARYMHLSNPGNIYPAHLLTQFYLSSTVGKIIFRKFNMSLMTWPRPPGYERVKL